MAKIYRCSDRIPIKIDDITVVISPMTLAEKTDVEVLLDSGDIRETAKGVALAIKYAVKEVRGVKTVDGAEYQVEMDGKYISDSAVDDLCNLKHTEKLALICSQLRMGIPEVFSDKNGDKMEGVEFCKEDESASKNA